MEKLPEEVLCRILQPLTRKDLRNASMVNRKFARITASILYSDVFLSSGHGSVETGSSKQLRLCRRFMRNLVENPSLGDKVKYLHIGDWQSNSPEARISSVERTQIARSVPGLAHCPSDYYYQFEFDIIKATQDAMTAAILSFMPNLKSLSLNMDHWCHEGCVADWEGIMDYGHIHFHRNLTFCLIELSTTPNLSIFGLFKNLTDVLLDENCVGNGCTEEWNFRLISIFMKLPSLKKFTGRGCRDMEDDPPQSWIEDELECEWSCDEGISNVAELKIWRCKIGAESLSQVVRSSRALENFACGRRCKACFQPLVDCDYSLANIHHDLNRHRHSLRCLNLHSKSCGHENLCQDEPVESFAALEKLSYLLVDEGVLMGNRNAGARPLTAILPPHLEHLVVFGEKSHGQQDLFREIGKFLLSSKNLPVIEVRSACVMDAKKTLEEFPGTGLRKIKARAPNSLIGPFVMYKCED